VKVVLGNLSHLLELKLKIIFIKRFKISPSSFEGLNEAGKMLGGWRIQTLQKTSHESEKKK
jgi:hypothetical protein